MTLVVQNEGSFPAGGIMMVPDLKINGLTPDLDGELIKVKFSARNKKTVQVVARGRTLYITGGAPQDRVIITTKRAKKQKWGDRCARVCGLFTDGGFMTVKIEGTLDKLQTTGLVRQVVVKRGNLGQDSRSRLFDLRFSSNNRAVIKTFGVPLPSPYTLFSKLADGATRAARKPPTNSTLRGGIVCGNILVGQAYYTNDFNGILSTNGAIPEYVVPGSQRGMNVLVAKQGRIGTQQVPHWIAAQYVRRTICTKNAKVNDGGDIVNFSYYLTGTAPNTKQYSVLAMAARRIADSSTNNVNTQVICGHEPTLQRPWLVTNWVSETVIGTIRNIKGGELLQGTFRMARPPKKINTKLNQSRAIIGNSP
jgi:hypothetical protein